MANSGFLEKELIIELWICDPRDVDKSIMRIVEVNFREIIGEALKSLPGYKHLDRCEPSFASIDEKKQLRLCQTYAHWSIEKKPYALQLHQGECEPGSYFTLEELVVIGEALRKAAEKYVGYGIFCKIVCSIDTEAHIGKLS